MNRHGQNDDQVLMLTTIGAIALLVLLGMVILAFAPSTSKDNVIPLVSVGVTAISSFARRPAFPALALPTEPAEGESTPMSEPTGTEAR